MLGEPSTSSPGAKPLTPGPTASTDPRHVDAQPAWLLQRLAAGDPAVQDLPVDRVDARGADSQRQLALAGLGLRQLLDAKHIEVPYS